MTISTGTLRVGILAILAGLVGAYVIQQVLQSKPTAEAPAEQARVIPLASADLPEGRIIAMGDIAMVKMTQAEINKRGVPLGMVMSDPQQIIGRRLQQSVTAESFFTTNLFYLENNGPDLAAKLKPGYRAYSMLIPDVRGGSVTPGTIVDVIFRSAQRDAKGTRLEIPEKTVTLLQSVNVIHVERPQPPRQSQGGPRFLDLRRQRSSGPPSPTVTLAVTPDQAEVLQTVMGHGEISLSPYAPGESFAPPRSKEGVTLEDILGIEPPPPPVVPPFVPPFVTEIYRRGQADVRGYYRDSIHVWEKRPDVKPGTLPAPNALPAPMPAPMDQGAAPMGAPGVKVDKVEKPEGNE